MEFKGSMAFVGNVKLARQYLKLRAKDAVHAYRHAHDGRKFNGPVALAQYIARYY